MWSVKDYILYMTSMVNLGILETINFPTKEKGRGREGRKGEGYGKKYG